VSSVGGKRARRTVRLKDIKIRCGISDPEHVATNQSTYFTNPSLENSSGEIGGHAA